MPAARALNRNGLLAPGLARARVLTGKEKINGIDELKMIFSGKLLDNTKTFAESKVPAGNQVACQDHLPYASVLSERCRGKKEDAYEWCWRSAAKLAAARYSLPPLFPCALDILCVIIWDHVDRLRPRNRCNDARGVPDLDAPFAVF